MSGFDLKNIWSLEDGIDGILQKDVEILLTIGGSEDVEDDLLI